MIGRIVPLAFVLSLGACQGPSAPRTVLEDEALSFERLSGFEWEHDKGAVVLTSSDAEKKHSTIVIRSVRFDERHDRDVPSVLEATGASLAAMPNAKVEAPVPIDHPSYEAMRFEMTFKPHKKRKFYERSHVVVFANNHVYHVLHTAPEGRLSDMAKDFAKIVDTLEEEG